MASRRGSNERQHDVMEKADCLAADLAILALLERLRADIPL